MKDALCCGYYVLICRNDEYIIISIVLDVSLKRVSSNSGGHKNNNNNNNIVEVLCRNRWWWSWCCSCLAIQQKSLRPSSSVDKIQIRVWVIPRRRPPLPFLFRFCWDGNNLLVFYGNL
jgi:hypothetical protein